MAGPDKKLAEVCSSPVPSPEVPPGTFVAQVVLAAPPVAGRALGAGTAGLVRSFSNPVTPGSTAEMSTHHTPKHPPKPPKPAAASWLTAAK